MTILTNRMRSMIEQALLAKAFNERVSTLRTERASFAQFCYDDFYRVQTRKKMVELPDGWLKTGTAITVYLGETPHNLNYNGAFGYNTFDFCKDKIDPTERPQFYKDHGNKVYERRDEFGKTFANLDNELSALKGDVAKARDAIRTQTRAFTTVEKLIAHWPEVAPIITEITNVVVVTENLPVPAPTKANKLLGL